MRGGRKSVLTMYYLLDLLVRFVGGVLALAIIVYSVLYGYDIISLFSAAATSVIINVLVAQISYKIDYYETVRLNYVEDKDVWYLTYVDRNQCVVERIPTDEITGRKRTLDGYYLYGQFTRRQDKGSLKFISKVYVDNTLEDSTFLWEDSERSSRYGSI